MSILRLAVVPGQHYLFVSFSKIYAMWPLSRQQETLERDLHEKSHFGKRIVEPEVVQCLDPQPRSLVALWSAPHQSTRSKPTFTKKTVGLRARLCRRAQHPLAPRSAAKTAKKHTSLKI